MPALEKQTEIVHRVEILFAYADRLEARLQTAYIAASRPRCWPKPFAESGGAGA